MGTIAVAGAVFFYWRFVSKRAALILIGILAFGVFTYWVDPDQQACNGRTWFCDFVPVRVGRVLPPKPESCPPVEPLDTPIFQSEAANAEVEKMIQAGVCQQTAIDRVRNGWKVPYHPAFRGVPKVHH